MTKESKIILAILVITLIAGWFYWYELRPSQIKKECYEVASETGYVMQRVRERMGWDGKMFEEEKYRECLVEHGL